VNPRDGVDVVEKKQCHESNPGSSSPWPDRYTKLRLGTVHVTGTKAQSIVTERINDFLVRNLTSSS